ncbi:MAG: glyoxalase/bleomycin resistance/extradiol dioxygenase family protein [Planctomycetes bacterium]|nr:glyoxalase/bleomycin resistance/extradiol dioxygenase family protein [Planctomycetota bacterium]
MVKNPPEGNQRIIPYLVYDDAPKAIAYLCRVFGFTERFSMPMGEGKIGHAELELHGETLMLSSAMAEMKLVSPRGLPGVHAMVAVYVDDVDAHYARAQAGGAEITEPLKTQFYGDRSYRARDCEGHCWNFATHVKDISPEEMAAMMSGDCC